MQGNRDGRKGSQNLADGTSRHSWSRIPIVFIARKLRVPCLGLGYTKCGGTRRKSFRRLREGEADNPAATRPRAWLVQYWHLTGSPSATRAPVLSDRWTLRFVRDPPETPLLIASAGFAASATAIWPTLVNASCISSLSVPVKQARRPQAGDRPVIPISAAPSDRVALPSSGHVVAPHC